MVVKELLISIILVVGLILAGCTYIPSSEIECVPPTVKMLDMEGNPVCILPEIKEESSEAALAEEIVEEIAIEDKAQVSPITGAVIGAADVEETVIEEELVAQETPVDEEPLAEEQITGEVVIEQADETNHIVSEDVPIKKVMEGDLVSFPKLNAVDPDGDSISYSFSSPLNDKGEWQTKKGDFGEYLVTITVSDGTGSVAEKVLIVVGKINSAPVIKPLADITVEEGDTVYLDPVVTDADGDKVDVSYEGWMTAPEYTTSFTDAGEYIVTVTATDAENSVSEDVKIIVLDKNRELIFAPLSDITVKEGDLVTVNPTATDPDGDIITFDYSEPLNSDGQWQTQLGDVGAYTVEVIASDGFNEKRRGFILIVGKANLPPTIEVVDEILVTETETIVLDPTVTDPDGDEVDISYSGWFDTQKYTTTYDDGADPFREYIVTITASDGENSVSKDISIKVFNKNRDPVLVGNWWE